LTPNSRLTSESTIGLGCIDSFEHEYDPELLKTLVKLKVWKEEKRFVFVFHFFCVFAAFGRLCDNNAVFSVGKNRCGSGDLSCCAGIGRGNVERPCFEVQQSLFLLVLLMCFLHVFPQAIVQKQQPTLNHKATVIVVSKVDGSNDAKINVTKSLNLSNIEAIAGAKVMRLLLLKLA
jgi:hypothetical protein